MNTVVSSDLMETVMRSWDSEIQISHWSKPSYFKGAFSKSILTPLLNLADSPMDDESPPPPLSVMNWISPSSLASSRKSCIFFWV